MVRKWSSLLTEKRPQERTRDHVEPCSQTLPPVFPCDLMPVKHERHAVSPRALTTLTHNDPLLARFLRWPRVCCSGLGATAHLSGQKLLTFRVIYQLVLLSGNWAECSTEFAPMIEFFAEGSLKNSWSASTCACLQVYWARSHGKASQGLLCRRETSTPRLSPLQPNSAPCAVT